MTLQEVADRLGVHTNTVRRLVKGGQIGSYKVSQRGDLRFSQNDLDAYLLRQHRDASEQTETVSEPEPVAAADTTQAPLFT